MSEAKKAPKESAVKEAIRRLFKAKGIWYFMPCMNGYGRPGIPDFVACVQGRMLAIEAKAGRGVTSKYQEMELGKINAAGGVAVVVNETRLFALEALLDTMLLSPQLGVAVGEGFKSDGARA